MLKLVKYMTKFWVPILFSVVLLFGQSQAELSLPDYMSDIVSVGIQAGGFNSPISEVLTTDTYLQLSSLMNKEEQEILQNSYQLVAKGQANNDIKKRFPLSNQEDVYVLKELSNDQVETLESIVIKPMLIHSAIHSMDNENQAVSSMDDEAIEEMLKDITIQMEFMGESTVSIAVGNGVKAEYQRLGANTDQIQMNYITTIGLKMLGIALLGALAAVIVTLLASRVGSGLARDLRTDIYTKVEGFSNDEFNSFSTASLITRTTNDITQVQNVMTMVLRIVCFAPMMGIGALLKVLSSSPSMTWIIVMVLVVMLCIIGVAFVVVLPKFKVIQKLIDRLNLTMRENLSGMLVIRAFGNEAYSEERFHTANDDLTKVNLFVNKAMASIMPLMMFMFNIVTLLIVWYGAKQIDLGYIDIGQMLAFMQYAMHVIMSFLMIAVVSIMIPRASVAAERIFEVINTEPTIIDPQSSDVFEETKKGLLEFKNVSFRYAGAQEAVLSNISFTASPGKTTAFIGSTGSGKSTLINLIPRFYEVSEGAIYLGGVNIRNVKQHDLRERIGLVPQKGLLFSGTIRSNLTYGARETTDAQLEEVIRIAQAKEFIEQKEEGLDSEISQGGTNVSGGQRQRLAIGRAIAKNPEILIFDDSFSALDFKTDAALRKELEMMCKKHNNTVILVGQRIASIMSADQIIVLDEGKIVGKGSHESLMKECKVYQEIAYSQLSKEELGNE